MSDRELCSHCGGNGTVKIPGGISVCPKCDGHRWAPAWPPSPPLAAPGTGPQESERSKHWAVDGPALSIHKALVLLEQRIVEADTPHGEHPFLFDTMSLREAKQILSAFADQGMVDGPRGYAMPDESQEDVAREYLEAGADEVHILTNHAAAPGTGETPEPSTALRLAKEATNGWACYAKRQIEHAEIARLHREIQRLESAPETPQERQPLAAGNSDEYYLAMAALDRYPIEDGLPKSTSVPFRIHQIGHALEQSKAAGLRLREGLRALEVRMRDQALVTLPMHGDLLAFADELKHLSQSGAE